MAKYRKKPVEIEAVRFKGSTTQAVAIMHWIDGGDYVEPGMATCDMRNIEILTSEGLMIARPGDWIIRDVKGEFHPCKPNIFEATYGRVVSGPSTEGDGTDG